MNGDSDKPESNQNVISWVVITLCVDATIGVLTLSYSLIANKDMNIALFTAFVAIVNYILGVISGMLAKTSATQTTSAPATIITPVVTPVATPVEIKQPPNKPIPVVETPSVQPSKP